MRPTKSVGATHTHVKFIWFQREIKIEDYFSLSLTAEKRKKQFSIWIIFGGSLWKFRAAAGATAAMCLVFRDLGSCLYIYLSLSRRRWYFSSSSFSVFFFFLPKLPQTLCLLHRNDLIGWLLSSLFFLLAPKKNKLFYRRLWQQQHTTHPPTFLSFFEAKRRKKETAKISWWWFSSLSSGTTHHNIPPFQLWNGYESTFSCSHSNEPEEEEKWLTFFVATPQRGKKENI
jgi:hypothetical protein